MMFGNNTEHMTESSEKRVWCAFGFGFAGAILCALPFLLYYVLVLCWGEPGDNGAAGFGLLVMLPMLLLGLLSWLTSLVVVVIIAFRKRRLLYTRMGIGAVIIDVVILAYIGAMVGLTVKG
jgi:hypothetical protein